MNTAISLIAALLSITGQVDLPLSPSAQTAVAGQIITVELYAVAAATESITAVDAIVAWDPARLELLSAAIGDFPVFVNGFLPDPDGINDDITDGEALYTALAPPTTPAVVPPDLLVVTFSFKVLTSACVSLTPSVGTFGKTRVIGTVPGVEITGVISGAVSLEVPGAWVDLGNALAGTGGLEPAIAGEGNLLDCEPASLIMTDALPNTQSFLVVGQSAINLPVKGGVLVPDLDLIFGVSSGPTGAVTLSGSVPPGLPAGLTTYFQYWFVDPGAAQGFSASNALSATTP